METALRGHESAVDRLAELSREIEELVSALRASPQAGFEDLSIPAEGARLVLVRTRTTGSDDRLHLLANPAGRANDPGPARTLVAAMLSRNPGAHAGISAPVRWAAELAEAHREAADLAELAAERPERFLVAEQAWAALAVRRLSRPVAMALPKGNPIARLNEYDAARRRDLARSVFTWIQCNCDVGQAAAALYVHPNTLRYRLQRASQVSELRLDDADERMLFQLLYRASDRDRPAEPEGLPTTA